MANNFGNLLLVLASALSGFVVGMEIGDHDNFDPGRLATNSLVGIVVVSLLLMNIWK